MNNRNLPIGVIDSGLGGISVLKEACRIMPDEQFIYFGDSANAPYGTRPTEEIKELTFKVVEKLMARGIKGLMVACNTATGAAVRELRLAYPDLPLVGIEPAIKPAVEKSRGGTIVVMATPMTLKQEKFHALLSKYESLGKIVTVPCAGLMEFVEEAIVEEDKLQSYFAENLMPYLAFDTETIVLGCTHYSFLRPHLRRFLKNDRIEIIDGNRGTAAELRHRLEAAGLLRDGGCGGVIFENSLGEKMVERSNVLFAMPTE